MMDMAPDPLEGMPADGEAMSDQELVALCQQHEEKAVGYYTSDIAEQQAKAIDYYYGRPFGDERPGRSQVVERTVAITIDNALAALLKPFVSAEDVVSFEPRGPEDEEVAEQATEYVNYVFNCDNNGFLILHDWFKDALLTKIGVVKFWWEDTSRQSVEQALTDAMGLEMARADEGYLDEQDNGDGTFTVSFQRTIPDGRVKIQNVPPEEFLISPLARSIEEAPYVAHRPYNITRSDLIEMGFDPEVVMSLSAFAQGKNEESRSQSRYEDEEWTNGFREAVGNDPSRDTIALVDEFVKVDYNGDGVAELRRIIRSGDTILLNEEADEAPFALLCPVPMSHKVYGLSLADQVMDLQRISSVVWRQTLDNLYLSNNPRPIVPDGVVNERTFDSLMDPSPGAEVSVKGADPNGIGFLNIPFVAEKSFGMLEYIEQQTESRTGVSRAGQGLDTNALKKSGQMTATEMAIMEGGKNARVEMIARIFAETGVTRLFKGLLNLVSKYQPKERVIRLRNKWVEIDPRGWPEMDVRISVGLGIGNKMDQLAQADSVLETMTLLAQSPYANLQTPENVYNAVKRKYQAAGVKNTDDFVTDPANTPPQEPQPDPEMAKVEAEAQRDAAKLEMEREKSAVELESKREEGALKIQLAREEAAAKLQLERERAAEEAALAREKWEFEREMAREKMREEIAMAREQAARQHEVAMKTADAKISQNRPGGDLDK